MADANKRKDYSRIPMVDCPVFRNLYNTVGGQRAADLMGLGYSTAGRYNQNGKAPLSVEKAAELEMMKRSKDGKSNLPAIRPDEIVILKVPESKMEYLMMFLKGADIKHARFKDA